ncbi:DNA-3-methyladenine glycosylase I [Aurantivibrio plasticivorans]
MLAFEDVLAQAVKRKGSRKAIEESLPKPKSATALANLGDDRYLSEMSRRVFRAGLKHSMVDGKWPAFEKAFKQFNVKRVASFSDEELESLAHDKTIIRHFGKIKAVRENARWLLDVIAEHGSVGQLIGSWPVADIVGLWTLLKKQGAQMGGQSGSRFLRMVGKDTFLMSDDVVTVMIREGVIDKTPTSQRDLKAVQHAFNQWHDESGLPMCAISRIVSYTSGDNYPL